MRNDHDGNISCPECGKKVSNEFPFCPFCRAGLNGQESEKSKQENNKPLKPGIPENYHKKAAATFKEAYSLFVGKSVFLVEIALLTILSYATGPRLQKGMGNIVVGLSLYVLFVLPFIVSVQVVRDKKCNSKSYLQQLINFRLFKLSLIVYFFGSITVSIFYAFAVIDKISLHLRLGAFICFILAMSYFLARALLSILIQCITGRPALSCFKMARKMYLGNELNVLLFVGKITGFMIVLAVGNAFADFTQIVEYVIETIGLSNSWPDLGVYLSNFANKVIFLLIWQMTVLILTVFFRDSGGFLLAEEKHWNGTWKKKG